MTEIYRSATEYRANQLTILRGSVADILSVGVFHATDPNDIPDVADFITVTLTDGETDGDDPLAELGKIDILSLIGPRDGQVLLTPGDYQRFTLVTTATEDIIDRIDTVTVL